MPPVAIILEPLPLTGSANANVHEIVRPSADVLLLKPGSRFLRLGLIFACFTSMVGLVCSYFGMGGRVALGLTLLPAFGAAGIVLVHFSYQLFGTCVRFDRGTGTMSMTGARHGAGVTLPLASIAAIQLTEGRRVATDDGSWTAFQVNLVLVTPPQERVNLLDSGGLLSLRSIAETIADFLHVPLLDHSTPTA